MALSGLGLFLLEACAGTALPAAAFSRRRSLGRGFFSLHGGLAAVFARPGARRPARRAALRRRWRRRRGARVYTLAAHAGHARAAGRRSRPAPACAAWALARVALVAPREAGDAWTVVGALAGGLFFGAVLLVMNLGHWYLVSRSLPFRLLARGAALFAGLAIFRTVYLALARGRHTGTRRGFSRCFRSSGTRSSSSSASSGASSVRSRSRTSSGGRPR